MKRCIGSLCVLCVLCAVFLAAGCNGVVLNATYSQLLDETAALSKTLADRAEIGRLDPNIAAAGLRWNADAWRRFQDGRDGRDPVKK